LQQREDLQRVTLKYATWFTNDCHQPALEISIRILSGDSTMQVTSPSGTGNLIGDTFFLTLNDGIFLCCSPDSEFPGDQPYFPSTV
jgi:hypothetical protein